MSVRYHDIASSKTVKKMNNEEENEENKHLDVFSWNTLLYNTNDDRKLYLNGYQWSPLPYTYLPPL